MGDDLKQKLRNLNNPTAVSLFLHLFFFSNNGKMTTGRKQLADSLGTTEQRIRTALSLLVDNQLINQQSTKRFSTIHILNFTENNTNANHQSTRLSTTNDISIYKTKTKSRQKEQVKKPDLSKLQPLTPQQIWQIAWDENVALEDARQVHKEVLLSVEDGNKYKIKDVNLATRRWLIRKIGLKQVYLNDEYERIVLQDYEPAERARIIQRFKDAEEKARLRREQREQEEKQNKPN